MFTLKHRLDMYIFYLNLEYFCVCTFYFSVSYIIYLGGVIRESSAHDVPCSKIQLLSGLISKLEPGISPNAADLFCDSANAAHQRLHSEFMKTSDTSNSL